MKASPRKSLAVIVALTVALWLPVILVVARTL